MPKCGMPAAVCIWPGLPSLWERGSWAGLGLAVVFAGLLNVLLVASTVWTDSRAPQPTLDMRFRNRERGSSDMGQKIRRGRLIGQMAAVVAATTEP